MPQDLRFESHPSDAQRAVMESLGFVADEETDGEHFVDWRGHGVVITLPCNRIPTGGSICGLIAKLAEQKGISKIRKTLWSLIGLRPLDSPVPFELLEMEMESESNVIQATHLFRRP